MSDPPSQAEEPKDQHDASKTDAGIIVTPGSGEFDQTVSPGDTTCSTEQRPAVSNNISFLLLLIGLSLAAFVVSLDRTIVATAVPRITDAFHSPGDVGWYGSAYLLTSCAFQPIYGRVFVHFDVRSAYYIAFGLFELGCLISAVAPNSTTLIVGRAIAGIGDAGVLAGNMNIISLMAPLDKRPIYIGMVGAIFGIGSVMGPIIGGALTQRLGWRWAFYISLPVAAVTLISLIFFFQPPKNERIREPFTKRLFRLDLPGNLLIVTAVIMLLLALQWSGVTYPWNSSRIIGLLVGFGVESALFLAWQKCHGKDSLLPLHIMTERTVAACLAAAFFLGGATLLVVYYLPYWFQAIGDSSPLQSGINLIPYAIANFLAAVLAGIIVTKTGFYNPPALIGPAVGAIGAGLLCTVRVDTSTGRWIGYEIIAGAGFGAAIQQYFLAIQTILPADEVPIGTALLLLIQNLSGAIFVSIGNAMVRNRLASGLESRSEFSTSEIVAILSAGATDVGNQVNPSQLPALLEAYNQALRSVFILAIPLSALGTALALPMRWNSLKKKVESDSTAENSDGSMKVV
ncbi:hypothetical protein BC1G_12761 [Paecilomyces variotii No. 5]|uniref:Major facilitator superfamily (MFS) profile domain-containing protein n=1 Tax=Byssochlamys spectabilis (strain No. 5 / NBRC 109023) TaxID=1356009 RepID=V5FVH0_BYSSN|nr:hypothetical protein BC1G_12761 [Paecilomyces variotii No. 5]